MDNVIVDDTISATENSYTITSLEPNTDYTIIVRKVTDIGDFDSSEETVRITTALAPIIQTITSPTATSRDITWTPEANGDAVVEKYAILLDGVIIQDDISKDTFTWSLTDLDTDTSNQSFTLRKFTNLGNIESSSTILEHTWTTGLSAKSIVFDNTTYDVGDVIDLDIITEGPTNYSFEVEFSIGLTSSPNGSDASEYPQGSYNYSWYMLHRNNGWQVYRGDQLSADRYYKSQIGPGYPDELYTQFINQYLRMTIISDSQVEYKYYTDSSRTTLHALDPVRIITQQFSLPAYVFVGPEATESYGCNRAGNSISVIKKGTISNNL